MKSWIMSVMKSLARHFISLALESLKDQALSALAIRGPVGLDAVFDGAQLKTIHGLDWLKGKSWVPKWSDSFIDELERGVQAQGDILQERAKALAAQKGPAGVEFAFAQAKAAIMAVIDRVQ